MSQLLQSGPLFSQSQMMTSFTSCASLTAVLSAFENLKIRYNQVKKENKRLKDRIAKYEENNPDSTEKQTCPKRVHRSSGRMKMEGAFTDRATSTENNTSIVPESNADHPTVHSIVCDISEQLTLIGLQLESLLLDFDKIGTKEEIYKVHETVKTVVLPRLIEIRQKEIESAFANDQVMSIEVSEQEEQTNDGSMSEDSEEVTENLLKLRRLLKKQNIMLKNLVCFNNEGGGSEGSPMKLGGVFPMDGWSVISKP